MNLVMLDSKTSPLDLTSLPAPLPRSDGDYFFVQFEITQAYVRKSSMADRHERPEVYRYSDTRHGWLIQKDAMIQETGFSKVTLSAILSAMNIPDAGQSSMADQILTCALDMANHTHRGEKILAISVKVIVASSENEDPLYINDDDEEYESDIESADDEEGEDDDYEDFEWVPAASSSIEGLERVKLGEEGRSVNGVCTICLEDFVVDSEAIRMPCLHMYHLNCIVGWLQKTNSCPLCRFTMPTTELGC